MATHPPEETDAAARNAAARPQTQKQRFDAKIGASEFAYVDIVQRTLLSDWFFYTDAQGIGRQQAGHTFGIIMVDLWAAIRSDLWNVTFKEDTELNNFLAINDAPPAFVRDAAYYQQTTVGMSRMIDFARQWFGANVGVQLSAARSGTGSRGPRGPTAEDIRQQFDVKQLAEQVDLLNRALVLEEHDDPMGLAREYVNAVVSTLGKQKIDFDTFVRERIEKTSRFKSIYRNKPDHISAELYLAPYLNAAMGFARPDEAAELAIGGAKFGASSQAFAERLKRTDAFTGSAPFINSLEGTLSELNSIFKG